MRFADFRFHCYCRYFVPTMASLSAIFFIFQIQNSSKPVLKTNWFEATIFCVWSRFFVMGFAL